MTPHIRLDLLHTFSWHTLILQWGSVENEDQKRYDFNFLNVNFPCSNIPAAPVYEVYISSWYDIPELVFLIRISLIDMFILSFPFHSFMTCQRIFYMSDTTCFTREQALLIFPEPSTNKTDHHDITEILLKVAFNTTTITLSFRSIGVNSQSCCSIYIAAVVVVIVW